VITVIGSLNMDMVSYVTHLPKMGETVIGRDLKQIPGGKGANQADAVAKLGGSVRMLGSVGDDHTGRILLDSLHNDGVDISQITLLQDVPTGIATINVDAGGNNFIVVAPGANYQFVLGREQNMEKLKESIAASTIVVSQLEIPVETVRYSLQEAKELGKFTILNPAPACALDDTLLSCVDLLIPNETELEILSGLPVRNEAEIIAAAKFMVDRGAKEVIVTVGDKGCVDVTSEHYRIFDAYRMDTVDTTAAGDSFIGAMALALSEGKETEEAIGFAMAVAALTVTKKGAQESLPYRWEVEEFLNMKKGVKV
jgi:ribokinase